MKNLFLRVGRLWCVGLGLMGIRIVQNQSGFDSATGLAVPSLYSTAILAVLAICFIGEFLLCARLPKEKTDFSAQFAAPEKELLAIVLGSLLLAAGGALFALQGFQQGEIAMGAAGILALAAGAGILWINRRARAGEPLSVMLLLPAMFFSVFFVLAIYLPFEDDPVFLRYYLPVLTSAMIAYSFSLLAGFLRKESSPRRFIFFSEMTVILCLASIADGNLGRILLFAGCAFVFSVYLLLWKDQAKRPGTT